MEGSLAIIILAAGQSLRLGHPKQLLPFKGKTLLSHVIDTAHEATPHVFVVLGAERGKIEGAIKTSPAEIIFNDQWEEGMASSIRTGLNYVIGRMPELSSVFLMVCDQPFVTADLLHSLIQEKEITGKSIIASSYAGIAGTPVLFDKSIFPELLELKGDTGARKIIAVQKDRLATVAFVQGEVDMDTADDYRKLLVQKDLL